MSPRRKAAEAEMIYVGEGGEEYSGEQLQLTIPDAAYELDVIYVEHGQVYPDPEQPRKEADAELRASIAAEGILQPITVRPRTDLITGGWWIVDGERRWRGAQGVQKLIPVIVRQDQEHDVRRLVAQLTANTGKPLSAFEEALAYRRLADAGLSVTEIAARTGAARTTVGERLHLLEIGPWLDLVRDGTIPYSHAVKCLLPIRGLADKHHLEIIEKVKKDWQWKNMGDDGLSLQDFEDLIADNADAFFYPLSKSKYSDRPSFDTRLHDQECSCGRIKWDGVVCCGNPDWWKPRHKKGAAAKKSKEAGKKKVEVHQPPGRPKLDLPEGAKTVSRGYGDAPKGVVVLTDANGHWSPGRFGWRDSEDDFDPADLQIDESKLVRVESQYSCDVVGTTDVAAVKAARQKWAERWDNRRSVLLGDLVEHLERHKNEYAIGGSGAFSLLRLAAAEAPSALEIMVDVADALALEVPAALRQESHHDVSESVVKWLSSMDDDELRSVATGTAILAGIGIEAPSKVVMQEKLGELQKLTKKAHPWVAKPKKEKAAKAEKPAKKKSGKKAKKTKPPAPMPDEDVEYDDTELAELESDVGDDIWDEGADAWRYEPEEEEATVDGD